MKALEHRIPPPLLMLVIGGIMAMTLLSSRPAGLPDAWRWGAAALFFAAAGVFGIPAFGAFKKARTTINPVQIDQASILVTTGIYSITRNPMYVALTLLLCALAAWLGRVLPVIGPIAFALFIDEFQIRPEERALTVKFADSYAGYRRSVRRWF